MDWYLYWRDFCEGMHSPMGVWLLIASLLVATCGAAAAHGLLRDRARSRLSAAGTALVTWAGLWLWIALSISEAIVAGYEGAWTKLWTLLFSIGTIALPLLGALLAIRRGYRCSWRQVWIAWMVLAVTSGIAALLTSTVMPNFLQM